MRAGGLVVPCAIVYRQGTEMLIITAHPLRPFPTQDVHARRSSSSLVPYDATGQITPALDALAIVAVPRHGVRDPLAAARRMQATKRRVRASRRRCGAHCGRARCRMSGVTAPEPGSRPR